MKKISEEHFEIKVTKPKEEKIVSFAPPVEDDGSTLASAWSFGADMQSSRDEAHTTSQMIMDYRSTAMHPFCRKAIDQIVYEAVPRTKKNVDIKINLEQLKENFNYSDKVIDAIYDAFDKFQTLTNFRQTAPEKFRNAYIDGRQFYHAIPYNNPRKGIKALRYVDPTRLNKVRKDVKAKVAGVEVVTSYKVKYIYTPENSTDSMYSMMGLSMNSNEAIEIDETAIISSTSGLLDPTRTRTISHLHEAVKRINQLNSVEDAQLIYRLSRAAEKRIFYVDVGISSEKQAERKIRNIQARHRHNMEYDSSSGKVRDNKNIVSMMHDYWIPRVEGRKTTEINTLAGAQNLNDIQDILQLYQEMALMSVNVPKNRLKEDGNFMGSRTTEVTREEVNFYKFIQGLQARFSNIFYEFIRLELDLTNIMSVQEFDRIKQYIDFDYPTDNHFQTLVKMQMIQEKIDLIQSIGHDPRLFFNIDHVGKEICGYTQEEMDILKEQYRKDLEFSLETNQIENPPEEIPDDF